MSASDRKEPGSSSPESETALSSSGIVVREPDDDAAKYPEGYEPEDQAPRSDPLPRRRDSDYRLTPYRARLDVEMDDTAVSKVRDPSVSLVLGPSSAVRPREKGSSRRLEAVASVALGAALGALLVVIIVLIARAF